MSRRASPRLRLIVGLGNPGAQYEPTRHNVGFQVIARLVRALDAHGPSLADEAELFRADQDGLEWVLARPLTYMNASGRAVRRLLDRTGAELGQLLVVYDDMALPPGQLRVRARGSSGSHRGMQSVIDALGTQEVARIRIGIGSPPPGQEAAEYVLSPPGPEEAAELAQAVEQAARAAEHWARYGIEAAMNRFNRRTPRDGQRPG